MKAIFTIAVIALFAVAANCLHIVKPENMDPMNNHLKPTFKACVEKLEDKLTKKEKKHGDAPEGIYNYHIDLANFDTTIKFVAYGEAYECSASFKSGSFRARKVSVKVDKDASVTIDSEEELE